MASFWEITLTSVLLEGTCFYGQIVVEAVRWNGLAAITPDVLPFRSSPLTDVAVYAALTLSSGAFAEPIPHAFVFAAVALQVASFLWVEVGTDVVALMLMVFLIPQALSYALHASLGMCTLLMLQPRLAVPPALWFHTLNVALVSASAFAHARGATLWSLATAIVGVELAIFAYVIRVYGARVMPAAGTAAWKFVLFNVLLGVKLQDARQWMRTRPITRSGLPEPIRRTHYFCESTLLRAVRFHYGRVASDGRVALWIGEWDEVAFANNLPGFVLALVFSLRIPISLRADVAADGASLENIRLVVCFLETPVWVWTWLTTQWRTTDSSCMLDGQNVFVGNRALLRRLTKLVIGVLMLYVS